MTAGRWRFYKTSYWKRRASDQCWTFLSDTCSVVSQFSTLGFSRGPSLWVLRQGWLPGYLAPCESSLAWDRGVCDSCSGWPGQQSHNTALWAPPQSILQSTAREEETSWLRADQFLLLPSLVLSPLCHRPTSQHVRLLLSEPLRFWFCLPSSGTSWPFGALTWVGMWGHTALLACAPLCRKGCLFFPLSCQLPLPSRSSTSLSWGCDGNGKKSDHPKREYKNLGELLKYFNCVSGLGFLEYCLKAIVE